MANVKNLQKKLIVLLFLCTVVFGQTERINKRTYNSKTFKKGRQYTTEIHGGHIHYKDSSGDFQDVDFTLEDKGTYWQMVKASYKLYVAKNFGDAQLIQFDNRFDGSNHSILFEPDSLQWVHKTNHNRILIKSAQSVTGVVDGHTIIYEDAFGANVDFIIKLHSKGFGKYIRFNTKPTLSPPNADYVPVLLTKYTGDNLFVKANDLAKWDGSSYYESEDGFTLTENFPAYKTYIRRAYIWDSAERQARQRIKLYWEKRNTVLWQAKVLPKAFFNYAVYPVIADTTTVFTVDSADGAINKWDGGGTPWDTAHDASSGTTSPNLISRSWEDTWIELYRASLTFNTGATIPANATISAATLSLYAQTVDDDDTGSITVVQSYQATVDSIAVGDYEDIGTDVDGNAASAKNTPQIEGVASATDTTTIVTNDWTDFTLNATGLAWIAKSGETKPSNASASGWTQLGLRDTFDTNDDDTVSGKNGVVWNDSTDSGLEPKLSVTYTLPGQVIIINMN